MTSIYELLGAYCEARARGYRAGTQARRIVGKSPLLAAPYGAGHSIKGDTIITKSGRAVIPSPAKAARLETKKPAKESRAPSALAKSKRKRYR